METDPDVDSPYTELFHRDTFQLPHPVELDEFNNQTSGFLVLYPDPGTGTLVSRISFAYGMASLKGSVGNTIGGGRVAILQGRQQHQQQQQAPPIPRSLSFECVPSPLSRGASLVPVQHFVAREGGLDLEEEEEEEEREEEKPMMGLYPDGYHRNHDLCGHGDDDRGVEGSSSAYIQQGIDVGQSGRDSEQTLPPPPPPLTTTTMTGPGSTGTPSSRGGPATAAGPIQDSPPPPAVEEPTCRFGYPLPNLSPYQYPRDGPKLVTLSGPGVPPSGPLPPLRFHLFEHGHVYGHPSEGYHPAHQAQAQAPSQAPRSVWSTGLPPAAHSSCHGVHAAVVDPTLDPALMSESPSSSSSTSFSCVSSSVSSASCTLIPALASSASSSSSAQTPILPLATDVSLAAYLQTANINTNNNNAHLNHGPELKDDAQLAYPSSLPDQSQAPGFGYLPSTIQTTTTQDSNAGPVPLGLGHTHYSGQHFSYHHQILYPIPISLPQRKPSMDKYSLTRSLSNDHVDPSLNAM